MIVFFGEDSPQGFCSLGIEPLDHRQLVGDVPFVALFFRKIQAQILKEIGEPRMQVPNKIVVNLAEAFGEVTRARRDLELKLTYRELKRPGLLLAGFFRRPISLQFSGQLRFGCRTCFLLDLGSGFS